MTWRGGVRARPTGDGGARGTHVELLHGGAASVRSLHHSRADHLHAAVASAVAGGQVVVCKEHGTTHEWRHGLWRRMR